MKTQKTDPPQPQNGALGNGADRQPGNAKKSGMIKFFRWFPIKTQVNPGQTLSDQKFPVLKQGWLIAAALYIEAGVDVKNSAWWTAG